MWLTGHRGSTVPQPSGTPRGSLRRCGICSRLMPVRYSSRPLRVPSHLPPPQGNSPVPGPQMAIRRSEIEDVNSAVVLVSQAASISGRKLNQEFTKCSLNVPLYNVKHLLYTEDNSKGEQKTERMREMKAWTVKFRSYNKEDYCETVSGKDEKEARKNAMRPTVRRDDRDTILWIKEDKLMQG